MKRILNALRFNEPQVVSNVLMESMILLAWLSSARPVWVLLLALSVTPTISLVANLIDPIKENER